MLELMRALLAVALIFALAAGQEVKEHLLKGEPRPWVKEAFALVKDPRAKDPAQVAESEEFYFYEYLDLTLGDRTFETVLLAVGKENGKEYVLELTPGKLGPPIAPEEAGDVLLLGAGENFWVFLVLEGPFKDHLLVWSSAAGHRGSGGEAVRFYSPAAAEKEPGLKPYLERAM